MQLHHCFPVLLLCLSATLANAAWAHSEYRVTVVGPPNSAATDINKYGVVTGDYTTASATRRAFLNRGAGVVYLRAPNGRFTNLGTLPYDDPVTMASALNSRNQVTGATGPWTFTDQPWRAFLWHAGAMRDLGDFGAAPNYGVAINECGQVTGSMSTPGGIHNRVAYLYNHGRLVNLDVRPASEERDSAGTGINGLGHVVGTSNHLSGFVYRGRRMQSLNALIDPALHWDIDDPQAINNAGQIAATARRHGVQYAVRLDLIRPMLERAPELEAQGELLDFQAEHGQH